VLGLERRHTFDKEVTLLDQPAHGACTMIRRQALLDMGGYDESFSCQDGYDLWLKFINHYKVENINLPLFYYRQHGNNLTRDEERILSTRMEIKRVHAKRGGQSLRVVGVVAVRGKSVDPGSLAMERLGGLTILDSLIKANLDASSIEAIAVTSSDPEIARHVQDHWLHLSEVIWIERPEMLSRLNVGILDTLRLILAHDCVKDICPDVLLVVSENYPFVQARYLDDVAHTMSLFDVDKVLSVRPETSMLYQHDGHGLRMILDQGKFTKLERDALYRFAGGISAFRVSSVEAYSTERLRIGHVVVDQRTAHGVYSRYDLKVAHYLASCAFGSK
jgi:CMP-N-acetylneuraminic acid synthetase